MIETAAGVAICAVSVLYISTVVGVIAGQRETDRREFHELIDDLRADLDALLDHLGLEIIVTQEDPIAGWPEEEPNPVEPPEPTTVEIPVITDVPATQPQAAVLIEHWSADVERPPASELVAAEPPQEPRTVEKTINGLTFRVREDAS